MTKPSYYLKKNFLHLKLLSFPGNSRLLKTEILKSRNIAESFSEISLNILNGNIPLNSNQKRNLKPYKNLLEKLVKKELKDSQKQRILIQNNNLVSLLLKVSLPYIETLLI